MPKNPVRRLIRAPDHSSRGQSLVEFALVLPLLLILLLGIADFGRVFQAGIVTESAARAAAEVAALEYLRNPPAAVPAPDAYYERIHRIAAETVCEEMRLLPNTAYAEVGGATQCLDSADPANSWPAVAVCIHDDSGGGGDTRCNGSAPSGFTSGPAECTAMAETWDPSSDAQNHTYVEVRVCYRFTTLFNLRLSLPMNTGLSLGDVYLQREADFTVADY